MLAAAALFHHVSGAVAAAPDGAAIYASKCAACHQAAGTGIAGTFPPLAGNPVVTGDPKKLIPIVTGGMSGKITVAGTAYNGSMPAWKGQLGNDEIAAVLTYIRSSWGNKASAIKPSQVKQGPE